MPQAKAAFQYPRFRYYTTARFLVTASSEMQSVAIGWQVYNLTHRARDLVSRIGVEQDGLAERCQHGPERALQQAEYHHLRQSRRQPAGD